MSSSPENQPAICARDGCGEAHYHRVTGAPPDYHYEIFAKDPKTGDFVKRVEPRWKNAWRASENQDDWWFASQELARDLGVTIQTVQRWFRDGKLSGAIKTPGGQWRVQLRAVKAYLQGQATVR